MLLCAFSINFEVTVTFPAVWSTQPDSQVIVSCCPVTITFFKMAPYRRAIMTNDIGKFGCDSMQQMNKKDKISEQCLTIKTFKIKFLTCNVFVFYKNLLCRSERRFMFTP